MEYNNLYAGLDFKAHFDYQIKTPDYHADKTAVNSSSLKKILKSPLAFHDAFYGKPKEPSDTMKFGTLAHLAILQPDKFKKSYVVMPEFVSKKADGTVTDSKNTIYYKQQVEEWKSSLLPEAVVVTQEEQEKLFRTVDAILKHKTARNLLKDGSPEVCGYWRDEETGIKCRMQADFISFNANALIDLKTTSDCSWDSFRRSVENYNYPFQLAMYSNGIKNITNIKPDFHIWIAVENVAPYEVMVYEMSPQYSEIGEWEYRQALKKLNECLNKKAFLPAQTEIEIGEPSYWYFKKYEDKNIFNV